MAKNGLRVVVEAELGIGMPMSSPWVVQDTRCNYMHIAALPPLQFSLVKDPQKKRNLAGQTGHAATMRHTDRTLTHHRCSPAGLDGGTFRMRSDETNPPQPADGR